MIHTCTDTLTQTLKFSYSHMAFHFTINRIDTGIVIVPTNNLFTDFWWRLDKISPAATGNAYSYIRLELDDSNSIKSKHFVTLSSAWN